MSPTTDVAPPADSSSELARVAAGAVEKGLAACLEDVAYAEALVTWLHGETGISRTVLRLAVKLFAQLVVTTAGKAGSLSGAAAVKLLGRMYEAIPGHERITGALRDLVGRLSREHAAREDFARLIGAGTPDPNDLRQYLTLDLQAARASFERLEAIIGLLQPQPQLDVPLEPNTSENRFLFAARRVELVGRDRHLAALGDFLNSDESFSWWLAAGPGGTGKSRLALEMCLRLGAGWRIGFLRGHRSFPWETWQPNQPTAFIVDYANEDAERVGAIVDELRRKADNGELALPVRVLLVAREAAGEWKREFLGGQVRRARIERASHGPPLMVDPLGDDELWTIITAFVPGELRLPARDDTLRRLREIDPEGRPLFASFAGDAISRGSDLRGWDQRMLASDVLDRERRHWRRGWSEHERALLRKHENLFALATLTGGLDPADAERLDSPLLPFADGEFDGARFCEMSGSTTPHLAPMRPDILGELFVLEHLDPGRVGNGRILDEVRRTGWMVEPLGVFAFLSRAVMDFPDHPAFPGLTHAPTGDGVQRLAWAMAAFNIVTVHGGEGRIGEARALYDTLASLSEAHPQEEALREQRAMAAFNLAVDCRNQGEIGEARALYDALVVLSEAHPQEAALREPHAKAALNLIVDYGNQGEIGEARALYDALVSLSEAHPEEAALREQRAKAAYNLTIDYGNQGEVGEVRALYDGLVALSEAHPEEAALREQRARVAFNLTNYYRNQGEIGEARALYEALVALTEAHPEEAALREQRAKAAFNLTNSYRNQGEIGEARALYDDLVALSEAHPEEAALREPRAMAAFNLLLIYAQRGDQEAAQNIYMDFVDLANRYPDDPGVREVVERISQTFSVAED